MENFTCIYSNVTYKECIFKNIDSFVSLDVCEYRRKRIDKFNERSG